MSDVAPDQNVHRAIAELARRLHTAKDRSLDDVLNDVVDGAVQNVPGVESASISVTSGRAELKTEVATDELAVRHNEIQVKHGEGPCLAAAWDEPIVRVDDLDTETRWPAYVAEARDAIPYRAILSFRLYTAAETLGSLTMYSRAPGNFGEDVEEIGAIFAAHAANAWIASERNIQFNSALASRDIIGQAKGMIMERFSIDAVQAFELLRRLSQDSNVKLVELATQLVETDHPTATD
ncbi:GAF and ANTAR domain-containing protein [Williamsia sp.]|uniref:GAF and ANTAR domain-containing protein n=1 Tax=Williamsia sp. TaxID=1872085 RepID=UPI001A1DBF66|nr:GAF and ANTAR domain-containing protein [Williamsia sp.]MBJ7289972.1 GAF and ANTAR domain-containing protein [Williamsia sp.]